MTTLLTPQDALSRRLDVLGCDSHTLLDRFWGAMVVPMSDSSNIRDSGCSFEEPRYDDPLLPTPEIFARSGYNPVINVKAVHSPILEPSDDSEPTTPYLSPIVPGRPRSYRLPLPVDRSRASEGAPSITLQPATPRYPPQSSTSFKQEPRKPKLSIPRYREVPGISSPGSALLALASSFLGVIVKLGRSQPSTPAPRCGAEGIHIIDSEILISVVDDAIRAREELSNGHSGVTPAGGPETGGPLSFTYSPGSAHQTAWSAEDMDQLAKLSWERQLMKAQRTL